MCYYSPKGRLIISDVPPHPPLPGISGLSLYSTCFCSLVILPRPVNVGVLLLSSPFFAFGLILLPAFWKVLLIFFILTGPCF